MLSICLPIYNFNVNPLVEALVKQCEQIDTAIEIVLIDDASLPEYERENAKINHEIVHYIRLKENVGRAKIRNLFIENTHNEYLLFLDCDSLLVSDDFISNYLDAVQGGAQLVCGGRVYEQDCPTRRKRLSWKYGVKRESQPAEQRMLVPHRSFMTNNFLIHRNVLQRIRFDERLKGYGHEDTLFGFHLKKEKVPILHIENPVLNGDVENNPVYLAKTEEGIANLVKVLHYVNYDEEFIANVKLLGFYMRLKSRKLTGLIHALFKTFRPLLKFMLIKGYLNLRFFEFYKIGVLIQEMNRAQTSDQ